MRHIIRQTKTYLRKTKLILPVALSLFAGIVFGNEPVTQKMYLSGTDNENTKTWEFYCSGGRNSGYWTNIEVPSHWEQQGFGTYNYGRDYMTYGKKFKFADEHGLYKYTFSLPEDWKDKEINIVFEGSMTDTEVKINGQLAGEVHQGSFYLFKYNITELLKDNAENLLEVKVEKWSSNWSVNAAERRADYWIFGGIFRPVYLEITPKEHVAHIAIDAKADGSFQLEAELENISGKKELKAEIIDAYGTVLKTIYQVVKKGSVQASLSDKIDNIKTWNQESPNLYKVKVSLVDKTGIVHSVEDKFGFRTIEIREGDGIYLNGTKIKMKGINRHVWWPETGRTINASIDLMDLKLIKEMNMNAVRCSHYPPDQAFLDICDSLGLYVIDELAGWQNAYDTEVGEKLVTEMVRRDVNHPSIILWSNGNEGGHNTDLDDDYGMNDPSGRPVIHAHHRPGNDFNGIDCNHYEDYYSSKSILEGPNIYMPTEFLHGQDDGGMAAGLADFWELFWNSKLSGGGFLWAMVDEGIVRTDMNGTIDVNRVNAPDGVLGPHREKEASFYAIREIYSPVKIAMEELPADFDGTIEVENRYHFTNLSECTFQSELINFNEPIDFQKGFTSTQAVNIKVPALAPVEKGTLKLDLPADWKNSDALEMTATAPNGDEILSWEWQIKDNKAIIADLMKNTGEELSVKDEEQEILLIGGDVTAHISKKDGTLLGVDNKYSQSLSFNNGPVLVGSDNAMCTEVKQYETEKGQVVEAIYEGDLKYIKWTMQSNGWLTLDYEYHIDGDLPYCGITFNYPESKVIGAKWLGNGPYRVWKNRMQGGNLNVYEKMYNNTFTGSSPWIYPEFKGYYSDIIWFEFNTVEGEFTVASEQPDLFIRLFEFYSISGPENLPALPAGNISFLDGIPSTPTKLWTNIYKNTAKYGPAGEPNTMKESVKRTLHFYFGLTE